MKFLDQSQHFKIDRLCFERNSSKLHCVQRLFQIQMTLQERKYKMKFTNGFIEKYTFQISIDINFHIDRGNAENFN